MDPDETDPKRTGNAGFVQSIFLFRSVHISALGEHRSSNLWFGRLCFPPSVVRTSVVAVIARRLLSIRPLGIFAQYRVRHVILEASIHFLFIQ